MKWASKYTCNLQHSSISLKGNPSQNTFYWFFCSLVFSCSPDKLIYSHTTVICASFRFLTIFFTISLSFFFFTNHFIFLFYFIFKLYIIVFVLPNIKMNLPQVYMCSPSWTFLPPPSPYISFFKICWCISWILHFIFLLQITKLISLKTLGKVQDKR